MLNAALFFCVTCCFDLPCWAVDLDSVTSCRGQVQAWLHKPALKIKPACFACLPRISMYVVYYRDIIEREELELRRGATLASSTSTQQPTTTCMQRHRSIDTLITDWSTLIYVHKYRSIHISYPIITGRFSDISMQWYRFSIGLKHFSAFIEQLSNALSPSLVILIYFIALCQ
jgi:hypothetical protein